MHERSLRTVLLIRAIEESDRTGEVLPLADRLEATRAVLRSDAPPRGAFTGGKLSPTAERILARRADRLRERMESRAPVVAEVLDLGRSSAWLVRSLVLVALLVGISMSALDGSRQINILAFPLLGLIAWNLLVYAVLIANAIRRTPPDAPSVERRAPAFYQQWIERRASQLLDRSSRFHAPLATALRRYAADWTRVARPMLLLRARRLLHVCAIVTALGLIAGLYIRGVVLRYEAGWESTFLGPAAVRWVVRLVYGPAAALAGIELPADDAQIDALRWAAPGRHDAAVWIHLIALTAVMYIVVPRAIAVVTSTLALWRASWRPHMPSSLLAYARGILLGSADLEGAVASVTTYAYEPDRESVAGLEALIAGALGAKIALDVRHVRYGDEDDFLAADDSGPARDASWNVLLMNLASTPEEENHGTFVTALRDYLRREANGAALLVVVDEGPYEARMQGDASLAGRLEERRGLWRRFLEAHGVESRLVNLADLAAPSGAEPKMEPALRDSVREALWRSAAQ